MCLSGLPVVHDRHAKTAEPTKMSFGVLTAKEPFRPIRWDQDSPRFSPTKRGTNDGVSIEKYRDSVMLEAQKQ